MKNETKFYVYEALTCLGLVWGGALIISGRTFLGVLSLIIGWYYFQKLTLLIHRDLKKFTTLIEIVGNWFRGKK